MQNIHGFVGGVENNMDKVYWKTEKKPDDLSDLQKKEKLLK